MPEVIIMKKTKIRISIKAYDELLKILNSSDEFSLLRIDFTTKCCGVRFDLTLDNEKENDMIDNVDEIKLAYNKDLTEKIKSITIIHKDNRFMIKHEMRDDILVASHDHKECGSCNSCEKKCSSCNSKK
jgi:hypothetical protein